MAGIRFLTAGESHGQALIGMIEGVPSNLELSSDAIDAELKRRQQGYGRSGRMKIESDRIEILSGVRLGRTIGSPIALMIRNKDWENWKEVMSLEQSNLKPVSGQVQESEIQNLKSITRPRPGHADLAGSIKYNHHDIRDILERSSARETAMRVALGAVAKRFLLEFNIKVGSYVIQIGEQKIEDSRSDPQRRPASVRQRTEDRRQNEGVDEKKLIELFEKAERSSVRCPDEDVAREIVKLIDAARKKGDSLGGIFRVFCVGVPPGLGSHIQWDKRIEGRLSQAVMSIQAIKGIEIGMGFNIGRMYGSQVMDEIYYGQRSGFYRRTNNAGGIEGGMTNGMTIVLSAVMKPIPTLKKPLRSIDIITKEPIEAVYERSDVCAVPAASIIAEAMISLIIADALLNKFGGDSIEETKRNFDGYIDYVNRF